ncbi:hypothetical protein A3860_27955 [Niastella vici]|uniref:HTTM domain-containing protein n=1 Tax=Niastella vici TaxID=1703345 RepID=A0A1V9FW25_9BACT|nr:hypothetical protein [Niastella vici]OQP62530.1 hypothetical protein A3860_27955 [Niastella vici]
MGKTVTHINFYTPLQRTRIARIVFGLALVSLLLSFFSHTLLHQLQQPVLKFPYVDTTYWVMHYLQLPEFITGHFGVAVLFDLALFASCLLSFLYPLKRLFIWSFIVLYFVYFITFNTFGCHHTNHKIGFLLIAIPFTVADYKSFNFLWQGLRYFMCFAFADAFLWKFFRLSWLYNSEGMLILKMNQTAFLYLERHTGTAAFYRWLLQYPGLLQGIYITGMIMEGLFIIGFFTRKYDRFLLLLSLVLPIGFWLIADTWFFELLILSLTFINFNRLYTRYRFAKGIKKGDITPV